MKFRDLKLIHFNNRIIGAEGDLYVHFVDQPELNVVIGICPNFFITLQAPTVKEFFIVVHDTVEQFLTELSKVENPERWATEHKISMRHVPNFLSMKRKRPKMPQIVLIEEETLEDLERVVRL